MTINRDLWHEACEKEFRQWPCPSCRAGILNLVNGSEHSIETLESKRGHDHEAWEPEWIDERFSAFLDCRNCGEVVVVSGKCSLALLDGYHPNTGIPDSCHADQFTIKNIFPSPPIFPVHVSFPKTVSNELKCAFSNYWSDHAACANSIRRTIEATMVEQEMKTTKDNGKSIFLHSQIEEYQQTNLKVSTLLLGIKWLGNYGSHVTDKPLSKSDLLAGFEVLEHALEKIYIKGDEYIENLAAGMTQNKGMP